MQLMMRRFANADITRLFRYDWGGRFIVEIPSSKSAGAVAEDVVHDVSDKIHNVTDLAGTVKDEANKKVKDAADKADAVKVEANRKVRDVVDLAHRRASSATYALFIVAGLLVLSLVFVLLFSNLQ